MFEIYKRLNICFVGCVCVYVFWGVLEDIFSFAIIASCHE